jgi:hypothetical protein
VTVSAIPATCRPVRRRGSACLDVRMPDARGLVLPASRGGQHGYGSKRFGGLAEVPG